ncbi:hypothetical protein DOT36_12445 [Vibrio vulnificus]|nr:hypothetical protein DOT36_12445 [Vibrio vulnificus]
MRVFAIGAEGRNHLIQMRGMRLPQWKKVIDKAIKKQDGIVVGAHRYKNAFVQKKKKPLFL